MWHVSGCCDLFNDVTEVIDSFVTEIRASLVF